MTLKKKRTKAWAHENKDRYPVNAFRIYRSKRPDSMNKDDSPFFLAVNQVSNREYYHTWFKDMPVGINHIFSDKKQFRPLL
jgi:hypothetical protein